MTAITLVFRTAIEYTGSSPVGAIKWRLQQSFKTENSIDNIFPFETASCKEMRLPMNRKEDYRDMEKYHKACQRQHRRYYSKTSFLYPSHPWTAEEDALVIKHEITDSELSEKIGRSVGAIHNRRYELKKLAR